MAMKKALVLNLVFNRLRVAIDLINGIGKRMPGFVWMMEGSGEPGTGNTETKIGGDPQFVSNLTVWESVETLENFVWNTVHRKFYERREEWFEVMDKMHFVMWWIEPGHEPTLDEALAQLGEYSLLAAGAGSPQEGQTCKNARRTAKKLDPKQGWMERE